MTPPTNLHALIAAGGWGKLSHAFLSAKAKAQLRDSHGRFIKMNSLVRWKDQDGKYRFGKVVGLAPDGSEVSVQEHDKSAIAKIKPKQLEVVKALIPDKPGDAPKLEAYAPDDKTDLPASEPLYVDTKGFKKVGSQAGSNSGGFYEGPDGTQFYVKKAQTEQHAANEVLAARLYKAAGVGVPDVYLTDIDGEPAVASKVVPELSPLFPSGKTTPATLAEARKGFAMDAWLGNWDSIGLVYDNMMKDKDGNAVRVDTGGALLYRAQGQPKGGLFSGKVGETDSLRDSSTNPQAAKIFGGMSDQDIAHDVLNTVDKVSNEDVDALVDDLPFSSDSTKAALKKTLLERKNDLNAKFGITQPDAEKPDAPQIPDAPDETPAPAQTVGKFGADGVSYTPTAAVNVNHGDIFKQTSSSGKASWYRVDLPYDKYTGTITATELKDPDALGGPKPEKIAVAKTALLQVADGVPNQVAHLMPGGKKAEPAGDIPPVEPPTDSPFAPSPDLPEKGAHVPGTKVTSTKDGYSGVVVKHNAKDGYSLVQSHDGTKKLWRKTDSLKVVEDAPAPAPSVPAKTDAPSHDYDATNKAISALGLALPEGGDEVPKEIDDILTAMVNGSSNQTDVDSANAWFDTYSADLPQEQSDAVWSAWQKSLDAAGFAGDGHHTTPGTLAAESQTVHPDPSPHADLVHNLVEEASQSGLSDYLPAELDPTGSDDELKQGLLDMQQSLAEQEVQPSSSLWTAMNSLAEQLGVDLPSADNAPGTDAINPKTLAAGDVINVGGMDAKVSQATMNDDGSVSTILKMAGGSVAFTFPAGSTANLVEKSAADGDSFESLPTTTTAGLSVGDKVMVNGKPMTVSGIKPNDTFPTLQNVTFLDDAGNSKVGAFGPDAPWPLVQKADSVSSPETPGDASKLDVPTGTLVPGSDHVYEDAQGQYVTTAAGHVLRVGDKVTSQKDGFSGTIVQLEKKAPYVKVKGADGKVKGRHMNTMFPQQDESVAPAADVTPDAPAAPADEPSLKPGDALAGKTSLLKPGMVVQTYGDTKYKIDAVEPAEGPNLPIHVDLTKVGEEGFGSSTHKYFPVFDDSSWKIASVPDSDEPSAPADDPAPGTPHKIAVKDLKPGDKIMEEDGTEGTIVSVDPYGDEGYTDVVWTVPGENGDEKFSGHFDPDSEDDFQKVETSDVVEPEAAPAAPAASPDNPQPIAFGDLQVGDKIVDSDGDTGHIVSVHKLDNGDIQVEYKLPDEYGDHSFQTSKTPSNNTYFKKIGSADDAPSPESKPEAPAEPVIGPKSVQDLKPGDIAHLASSKFTIVDSQPIGDGNYEVTYFGPNGNHHTVHLPGANSSAFGDKIESAVAVPQTDETPGNAVPSGTLVPGSSHVYKDAQGKYVVNKHGYVLREGMAVTSTKDGHTGTISFLELKAKYAKVTGPDGKKKGRQIDTLKPSDENAKKVDQPTSVDPTAPAPTVQPADKTKTYLQTGTKKPPQFKVGDVIGKDKKTVEYQKSSTKVQGKHEVKFAEDAEPLTVSKNNEWEHWTPTLAGSNGKKNASDFAAGDVVGEDENSKKKVKATSEWGETPGNIEVLFEGDPEWHSIPEDKSFYTWPKGTSTDAPAAVKDETPSAGPVQLSHDPIDFTLPGGSDVSVPPGGTLYKGFYWTSQNPLLVDGFGNAWKINQATGEKTPSSVPYYYLDQLTPDLELVSNPNVPDVTPHVESALSPDKKSQLIEKIDAELADSSYGMHKSRLTALRKVLTDPTGATMDEQDWDAAYLALMTPHMIGISDSDPEWKAFTGEFVKLQKSLNGTYRGEWHGHTSGQFHYDANERKALGAIGLSENAQAFTTTKGVSPVMNRDAAAEIYATVTNPAHAAVIDDLFGHGTSASIAKKTRGNAFREALSGNNSPYAKTVGDLPSTGGKNGTVLYLGDNVIASDGQGGQVTLVTPDGKVRVRRSDGTSFTRKGTQFVVTSSPVSSSKPTAAQTGEANAFTAKPRPEFEIPDWSKGNVGGSASISDVIAKIKSSNEAGNVGWSFASDGDQIEDLDVHASRVLSASGQEMLELKFKLTPKQGNAMFKRHSADTANWTPSDIKIEGRQVTDYSKLAQLTGHLTYESHGGRTLSRDKPDGTTIKFHRANGKGMDKNGSNPVAFHNMVQIRLPVDATQSDIAKAMYDAGVDKPGPATPEGVRRLGENRLMALFGKKTDAWVGNDAVQNRQALLAQIEKDWGITANDLLIAHGANGRFEMRMPQEVADKIIAKTGVRYFTHSLSGGTSALKQVGLNPFGALLSTSVRRTEGVKAEGQSSTADVHSGGADYMFTRLKQTMGMQLSNQVVFDARRLFQRMDWFSQTYDSWGKHSANMDVIGNTSPSATEAMFKHRLDLDDAIGYLVTDESERQSIIKMLKNAGVTHFGSRTVEEFVLVAPNTNVEAPTPPTETVPVASLGGVPA